MAEVKNNIFNNNIAGDTSNILVPDTSAIKSGVTFKSNINSNALNGYLNLLSESIQFLQFTGGLYDGSADYGEGNIASLVIKNGTDYSIWQFRRNANNPSVLNNNPPITGASITRANGVDAYEGGTLNTDWDKLTEDYAIEATADTVMGRDGEGASNVNMPSSITNTSIVNNEYLQQQLQAGLSTKQDTLTAGTNITISEDNVISASGDLATKAELVTYDNTNTNLEYMSGYDFPKFKTEIPETINLVLASSTSASITKQEDQSYRLQANLSNVIPMLDMIAIPIVSIEHETKQLGILNILLQFFDNISFTQDTDFSKVNFTNLELDECSISEIESSFKFALVDISSAIYILIKRQDDIAIPQSNYTVNLNIKNRVLRNQDINIFGFNYNFSSLYNLTLINNNANVKLTGSFTALGAGTDGLYFYNTIIENYFNLIDDLLNLKATDGITSSSGKALKFGISKISGSEATVYRFLIEHQDDTDVEAGEIFTFNLTPDKNSTLDPVYSPVANVQQLGEALNEKIDKEVEIIINEKLPDVYDYSGKETKTNGIAIVNQIYRKELDRKIIEIQHSGIRDGQPHYLRLKYSDYGFSNCNIKKCEIEFKNQQGRNTVNFSVVGGYMLAGYSNRDALFYVDYIIPSTFQVDITSIVFKCEYYKN